MASGPATAKNTTVATNVMNVDVIASGRRTPDRRMTHIMVGPAGAHPPGNDHVLQPDARVYVPGDDPQPRSSAEPVHRGESQPYHHPPPVEVQQRARDRLDVFAIHGEHDDDTGQRDNGEEFQAATEQARGEGEGHWGRN